MNLYFDYVLQYVKKKKYENKKKIGHHQVSIEDQFVLSAFKKEKVKTIPLGTIKFI